MNSLRSRKNLTYKFKKVKRRRIRQLSLTMMKIRELLPRMMKSIRIRQLSLTMMKIRVLLPRTRLNILMKNPSKSYWRGSEMSTASAHCLQTSSLQRKILTETVTLTETKILTEKRVFTVDSSNTFKMKKRKIQKLRFRVKISRISAETVFRKPTTPSKMIFSLPKKACRSMK